MASLQTAPIGGNTTDLSIQTFNGLFGTDWFSMDPSISGSASIIVDMLALLNELAIFAISLLFAATYLVAVVGTAHEGTPLGKRLHSFWVPVRFSLATGMLVPLQSGLCLFQLILLTTVGWSVHFANELWDVFLDSSVKSSIIEIVKDSNIPTPIRVESEKVAADVLSNLVVYKYLESQYNLGGQDLAYKLSDDKRSTLHYTWKFRDPATLIDDHRAFGSVEVYCRKLSTCDKELRTVVDLIKDLEPVATELVMRGVNKAENMPPLSSFKTAVDRFANKQTQLIKQTYADELNRLEREAGSFLDGAKELGWIGAGSYYHTILGIQSKAAELSMIQVTSSPANVNAKHDGFRQYENAMRVAAAYTNNATTDIERYIKAAQGGGSTSLIEMIFGEKLNVGVVGMAAGWMTEGDPIHAMSKLGNYIIGAVDGAIAAYVMMGALTATMKESKEASWFGSTVDGLIAQGGISGVLGGFLQMLQSLAPLFWMLVIALWSVAHVLAYYLPAVPLILWLSGVVGWMLVVVESLVAAPLWIVGHAMPEGDGLAGERGKQGYMLLLGVLVRPFLMLLGLCIAMILMGMVGKLVALLFTIYVNSFESNADFVMPIHSMVAYLVIFGAIMIILTHKLFGLIAYLPDNVLRWVGGHSPSLGEGGDESKTHMMVGGLVSRTETAMRGGAGASATRPQNASNGEKQNEGNTEQSNVKGGVSQATQQLAPGDKTETTDKSF